MQLKPARIGIGDHVTIKGTTHLVVQNYAGKRGGQVYINKLRTACRGWRFHNMSYDRTQEVVSCLPCLMVMDDYDGM